MGAKESERLTNPISMFIMIKNALKRRVERGRISEREAVGWELLIKKAFEDHLGAAVKSSTAGYRYHPDEEALA